MILAAFSSCCCYEFWLPFPPAAAEAFSAAAALLLVPGWENTMAVKDGEAHCTPKMPNVTSETHRK